MFELVLIALAATVIAVFFVWLFRKMTKFRGSSQASLSGNRKRMKVNLQQDYMNWNGAVTRRQSSRGSEGKENAKPWGW